MIFKFVNICTLAYFDLIFFFFRLDFFNGRNGRIRNHFDEVLVENNCVSDIHDRLNQS